LPRGEAAGSPFGPVKTEADVDVRSQSFRCKRLCHFSASDAGEIPEDADWAHFELSFTRATIAGSSPVLLQERAWTG
jgi:hypothetical protein